MTQAAFNYPVMLRLQGKKCVIIGGGSVAARKLASLGAAGASITVVAPSFSKELLEAANTYPCRLLSLAYSPEQLHKAFLVIAATDSFEVNRAITEAAPCLCNNVTEPELSNFTVPATLTADSITVTIATGGIPGYTRLLKRYLKQKLKPSFSLFNQFLKEQRRLLKETPSTPRERTAFWREVLSDELLHLLEDENIEQAKEQIQYAVDSFRTQSQNSTR